MSAATSNANMSSGAMVMGRLPPSLRLFSVRLSPQLRLSSLRKLSILVEAVYGYGYGGVGRRWSLPYAEGYRTVRIFRI